MSTIAKNVTGTTTLNYVLWYSTLAFRQQPVLYYACLPGRGFPRSHHPNARSQLSSSKSLLCIHVHIPIHHHTNCAVETALLNNFRIKPN